MSVLSAVEMKLAMPLLRELVSSWKVNDANANEQHEHAMAARTHLRGRASSI
jgi:hypothetical protein